MLVIYLILLDFLIHEFQFRIVQQGLFYKKNALNWDADKVPSFLTHTNTTQQNDKPNKHLWFVTMGQINYSKEQSTM